MQRQTENQEEGRAHTQVRDDSISLLRLSSEESELFSLILAGVFVLSPGGGRGRGRGRGRGGRGPNAQRPAVPQQSPGGGKVRSELKSRDQILKQRKKEQKQKFLQGGGMKRLRTKNRQWLSEIKKSGFGRGSQKKGKMKKRL